MKKPIIYGLTALCVLSAPAIVSNWNNSDFTNVYRTIASEKAPEFVEKLDAANEETIENYRVKMQERLNSFAQSVKEHASLKSRNDFNDLPDLELKEIKKKEDKLLEESKELSHFIQTGIEGLSSSTAVEVPEQFLNDFNQMERDLKNAVIKNEIKISVTEDQEGTQEEVKEKTADQATSCEKKDAIAELQAQVKELLKDKEEALAKVEEKKKKKKEREEKIKKAQRIYAMGMIFGQGLRASFAMPSFNFGIQNSPFLVQSPFASFNSRTTMPWFRLMSNYFSGSNTNNYSHRVANNFLGESPIRSQFQMDTARIQIPTFSRSQVEEESISVN
jgi:hypothetical protein